jgi:signal transduction histidine kinase
VKLPDVLRPFRFGLLVAALPTLAYHALLAFVTPVAEYPLPVPYALPVLEGSFALVGMGVAYLCLERHRLRQDLRSVALGVALWVTSLLALAHLLAQPEYAGATLGAEVAGCLFLVSFLVALAGAAIVTHGGRRKFALGDTALALIAGGGVAITAGLVALVWQAPGLLPGLVAPSGRLSPMMLTAASVGTAALGFWGLHRFPRSRQPGETEFLRLVSLASLLWLVGMVGFLIRPERDGLAWHLASLARPVGVGLIFVGLLREQVGLYREARARLRDLEGLHRAGHALVGSMDPVETMATIPEGALALLRADAAILLRLDPQARALRTVAHLGRISPELARGLELPLGQGAAGLAVARRAAVWSADLHDGERLQHPDGVRARLRAEGLVAALAAPVLSPAGEVFGALVVFHGQAHEFTDADVGLLTAFGTQASVAVENARAFERLALRARHDAALQDFGQRLLQTTDAAAIQHEAVTVTRELIGAELVGVFVPDPAAGALRLASGAGWEPGAVGTLTVVAADDPFAGHAFMQRRAVEVDDLESDRRVPTPAYLRFQRVRAGIAVPVGVREEPAGVLAAFFRGPRRLTAEETRVLNSLAHQTALALGRARLYGELQANLVRLQETQAQLIQADKLKALGTLLSGMAHELNNPLSTISLSAQLLRRRTDLPEPVMERLDAMEAECDRAVRIIKDLLVFARRKPPERQPVDVNDVVRASLTLQTPQFELNGIRVVSELAATPRISADAHQLQQVLINLFSNAAHAMKSAHGRGVLTVRSSAPAAGGAVCIVVEDDGPGIPPEALGQIFDPFFTTKAAGEGTGLGLSLSIGIVESHGGRLTVENVPGGGARFTMTLPALVAEEVRAEAAPGPAAPAVQRARVLVVDDEQRLRRLVVDVLRAAGHEVEEAATGQEALTRLAEGSYDCVMLDLRLPDVDGRTIWQWLLDHRPALALRLAFMTGDTMSVETERFLATAARPVLTKPFPIDHIGTVLQRIAGN